MPVEDTLTKPASTFVSCRRHVPLALAAAWVVFDGFYLDLGLPSMALAVLLTLVWLPFNLLAPRFRGRRLGRLGRYGLYMGAAMLAMGVKLMNVQLAQSGAERVITAVQAYHSRHGQWPERLEQLVPDNLPAIPRAKYVLADAGYRYSAAEGRHELMYVVTPPFQRRVYTFESGQWSGLD